VISPCVTFNDHEGSTKSYRFTRQHLREAVSADFVPLRAGITASYEPGAVHEVRMHDGSVIRLRKTPDDYDATDRDRVYAWVRERQRAGEVSTGLLFVEPDAAGMHEMEGTTDTPLRELPFEQLCPGSGALAAFMEELR
jgi:2-oxoglutarate/2-oxoacid ferredoxin oxidoreductase subunit beta